jgi:hypothetical protein
MGLDERLKKLEHCLDSVPTDDSGAGLILDIGEGYVFRIPQRVLDGGFIDLFNRIYGNFTPDEGERKAAVESEGEADLLADDEKSAEQDEGVR